MASHQDILSAPSVTPISSTSTAATESSSPILRNRFSSESLLSLSSVRSLLPRYSVGDTLEKPPPTSSTETPTTGNPNSAPNCPTAIEPPQYTLLNPHPLPVLSSRRVGTATHFEGKPKAHEFRYSYPIRPKNPWATLHLHTRNATPGTHSKPLRNQPRVPRFWSCDPITGTVQLDLDSPQTIQLISMTLNGIIVLSSHSGGSLPFLNHEFTLWDKYMGDPLHSDTTDSNVSKKKSDTRLASGQYSFPFSFPFPSHPVSPSVLNTNSISLFRPHTVGNTTNLTPAPPNEAPSPTRLQTPGHPNPQSYHSRASPMPPTFIENGIEPNVAYNISVRIVHGRFKPSSKIKANIAYFPASEPQPASQMRREAYEAAALVPCPMDDPEGWFALPTVTTNGVVNTIDDLLHTRVDCTLYIAQPLSYTRGSIIPCFITIGSNGVEVEQLLSSTEGPTVRLLRRVWHPMVELETPTVDQGSFGINSSSFSSAHVMVPTSDVNLVTHEVGRANWWTPPKNIVQGPNVRHLEGEIHLNPDLQPSCGFQSFRIEYAVELLTFETSNFKQSGLGQKADKVLASNVVEITSLFRQDEPVPTAYSEPPKAYQKHFVSSGKAI